MQLCLVFALSLCIGLTKFWPIPDGEDPRPVLFSSRGQETITIEQVLPTRQQRSKPAPPTPLPPIEVPNDELLEDVPLELDNLFTLDSPETVESDAENVVTGDTSNLPRPHTDAKAVRIVTPERPREAERKKIRAEVRVEVLVGDRGEVKDVQITDRYLLTGKEPYEREAVDVLGYGLEESAIAAAKETTFRPARDGGKPVESYTSLVFSFGI